jgi:hypothetical protein
VKKALASTATTDKKKVIPRHEEMSDTERKAKKLKRQIRLQNKAFRQAQKLNRPKLNKEKSLEEFSEHADETAKSLSELALRVMSLQTAFGYAQTMVSQDIGGDGVEWSTDTALKISDKIQVIETTRIMLKHYGIAKSLANAIINQTILRQFGIPNSTASVQTQNPNPGVPTFSSADVRQVLEQYSKDIGNGKP